LALIDLLQEATVVCMEKNKKSVLVYGMPVHAIDDSIYGGLFGNATRAVGLAYNFALAGRRTGLVVENRFLCTATLPRPSRLEFIAVGDLQERAGAFDVLLIACTNLESFQNSFGRDPYVSHPYVVYACCFDNGQEIDLARFSKNAKAITFNNKLQLANWRKRDTGVPAWVIPYGVNDLDYVDQAICDIDRPRAIWIGEFRRRDMLTRLFRFARANPKCPVSVVTRKIFDQSIPLGGKGSASSPYADFVTCTPESSFKEIVEDITSESLPPNVVYLGVKEGENHLLMGSHNIGLDFSRFPTQTHDNTKIMDYLRSGLWVICDTGTPSYRFVKEMRHGAIVSPDCQEAELRIACENSAGHVSLHRRRRIAKMMQEKYGWKATAERFSRIFEPRSVDVCQRWLAATNPRGLLQRLHLSHQHGPTLY
jgi:hypothetical protein